MKNYGIIRNVKTLEWSKVVPIFDNGQSMQCEKLTYDVMLKVTNVVFFLF